MQKTKFEKNGKTILETLGPLENQKNFYIGKHFWAFLLGLGYITSRILSI